MEGWRGGRTDGERRESRQRARGILEEEALFPGRQPRQPLCSQAGGTGPPHHPPSIPAAAGGGAV